MTPAPATDTLVGVTDPADTPRTPDPSSSSWMTSRRCAASWRRASRPTIACSLAEDGRQALELFATNGPEISAVVTDIRMPRMDGLALAAALRDRAIWVPILFVSGFGVIGQAPGLFLPKPFLPDNLLEAVRRLLDDAGESGEVN